jgi:hypothetical protein
VPRWRANLLGTYCFTVSRGQWMATIGARYSGRGQWMAPIGARHSGRQFNTPDNADP